MEHLKASPCGDAHESLSPQTEQFISLLERRGIVEDPEITSERVREAERELRRNMYHNTQRMLKDYRDIVWMAAVNSGNDQEVLPGAGGGGTGPAAEGP